MLLYRILRALGHERVRWVVDWSDHVWVEARLGGAGAVPTGGRWVHLDPCEAAVDEPLLYEGWGKNQTYIVAFHDPFYAGPGTEVAGSLAGGARHGTAAGIAAPFAPSRRRRLAGQHMFPPVEDMTQEYTSDCTQVIKERCGIAASPVAAAIAEVSRNMVQRLQNSCRPNVR